MNVGMEGGSNSQDFDLNIAPIIDCFTVLITFLLASASFLSIGVFDAGIAAGGTETSQQQPPSASITVELSPGQALSIKVENKNGSAQTIQVPAKNGAWDFAEMNEKLGALKNTYPDVKAVSLQAQGDIEYKSVIGAMEQIRKIQPVVMLAGF